MKSKKSDTSTKKTFASMMLDYGYRHDIHTLFDDFLTIVLSSLARSYESGQSLDEELYELTSTKYTRKQDEVNFADLFATLIHEMESRVNDGSGNDILGEFYELHLQKKGLSQFFTPFPICLLMAEIASPKEQPDAAKKRQRVIDPACGSGRTLLATARTAGWNNAFYGVDIDHTCVKMTALNLFFNGIFTGEIMCADALDPTFFRMSYRLSIQPFGIYRIENKEESELWQMMSEAIQKGTYPIPSVQQELPWQ